MGTNELIEITIRLLLQKKKYGTKVNRRLLKSAGEMSGNYRLKLLNLLYRREKCDET